MYMTIESTEHQMWIQELGVKMACLQLKGMWMHVWLYMVMDHKKIMLILESLRVGKNNLFEFSQGWATQ